MSYNMMIGYDIYDCFTMEHFRLRQRMTLTTKIYCSRLYIHGKKKQFKNRVFYGANINRYINTITIEINLTIIYFNIDQPFSSRFRTKNHLLRHFR
jgi:hypothetical protein